MTACVPPADTAASAALDAGVGTTQPASSPVSAPAWFPALLKGLIGTNGLLEEGTQNPQEKEPDAKKAEALGSPVLIAAPVPAPPLPPPAALNLGVELGIPPANEDVPAVTSKGTDGRDAAAASNSPVELALPTGLAWLPVAPDSPKESGAGETMLPDAPPKDHVVAPSADRQTPPEAVLAFAARLTPLAAPPDKPSPASAMEGPVAPQPEAGEPAELPVVAAVHSPAAGLLRPDASHEDSQREPAPARAPMDTTISSYASLARETLPAAKSGETGAAAPEAHRPAASAVEPPAPVAAHTPARDIRLQIGDAERHADVRLTERAGEVHVAVRTPDSRLAGALREDLPALAARLEATGFRAEAWHPGTAASETRWSHIQPASAGTPSDGAMADRHSGQQQQSRQQPKPPEPEPGAESQPKDFSWLLSSLH